MTVCDTAPAIGGGASWIAGGMLAPWCEAATAGPAVVELGRRSADWWEGAVPGHVGRKGTLVVAPPRDRPELDRFAARTQGFERLDADAVGAIEPDLAGRFRAALLFPGEAHLDPRRALSALARRLPALGVAFSSAGNGRGRAPSTGSSTAPACPPPRPSPG